MTMDQPLPQRGVFGMFRLGRLWRFLTEPINTVQDPTARLKSRWMAMILVGVLPLGVLAAAIPGLADPNRSALADRDVVVMLPACLFWASAYSLARRGRYLAASVTALVIAQVAIFATMAFANEGAQHVLNNAAYLLMPVMLSSLMLPKFFTVALIGVNFVVILALNWIFPELSLAKIIGGSMSLFLIGSAISFWGSYLRDELEDTHLSALQKENTERQLKEQDLKIALQVKEVLLKEIHHRVKNNMQVISSLVNLQTNMADQLSVEDLLLDTQNRIQSMSLVHEHLYQSETLAQIDFGQYVRDLCTQLFHSYTVSGVRLKVEADDIALDIDTSIPCGLIINELVSNALKHAFPNGRSGVVRIEIRHLEPNQMTLTVSDDGVGLPEGLEIQKTSSLGLMLVDSLAKQLHATLTIGEGPGTAFVFQIPERDGIAAGS